MLRVLYVGLTENDTVRGVERYAIELLRALAMQKPRTIELTLLCGSWQSYFRELENVGVRLLIAPVHNTRSSRHLFLIMRMRGLSRDFDLVHYGNLLPFVFPNAAPSTMTIHDVAEYALAGKYSGLQRAYRRAVGWFATRRVATIIADSEFTRREIVRFLRVADARIAVVYPGVDHFRASSAKQAPSMQRYFLYYGVIEETKGADTAIEAFMSMMNEPAATNATLVLIGRPGNAYERLKPNIDGKRIVHLGYMADAELQGYIADAIAVIFVSRYEGFGLPAVEAYMLNDTVIASRGHSVGEISGGFAINVDENNVVAVAAAMRRVLAGDAPHPRLTREAVRAKFSWQNTAQKVAAIFLAQARPAAASA